MFWHRFIGKCYFKPENIGYNVTMLLIHHMEITLMQYGNKPVKCYLNISEMQFKHQWNVFKVFMKHYCNNWTTHGFIREEHQQFKLCQSQMQMMQLYGRSFKRCQNWIINVFHNNWVITEYSITIELHWIRVENSPHILWMPWNLSFSCIPLVNSHQRWKQTRNCVCFHRF